MEPDETSLVKRSFLKDGMIVSRLFEGKATHCPFCKSKHLLVWPTEAGAEYVRCEECKASGPQKENIKEAVEAWNQSAQSEFLLMKVFKGISMVLRKDKTS